MNFYEVGVEEHIREKKRIALIISSYQPNKIGADLLRIALNSMLRFKREDSCIWVIDVGSPPSNFLVTPEEYPTVNFVITPHTPGNWGSTPYIKRVVKQLFRQQPPRTGSHANGWTLDFGIHSLKRLNYHPEYFMTLQMDVMFTRDNILDALLELFSENTAAVGVRKQLNYDNTEEILHSLGCMWDAKVYDSLNGSFMNDLPRYDVGEKLIAIAKEAGYGISYLKNTFSQPKLNELLSDDEKNWHVDKTVDRDGNIVFVHLGRGIVKTKKGAHKNINLGDWEHIYSRVFSEIRSSQ